MRMMRRLFSSISLVALLLGSASITSADLEVRMGGQAVYDSDLDITGVSDANLALIDQFGLLLSGSEFDDTPNTVVSTGLMTWDNANAWLAGMNAANHLGFNDWRLPTALDPDTSCTTDPAGTIPITSGSGGFNCIGSEMGHLIYIELGGAPGSNLVLTSDPVELAKFMNLTSTASYSGWSREFALNPATFAWKFEFIGGQQASSAKVDTAVRSGDVGGACGRSARSNRADARPLSARARHAVSPERGDFRLIGTWSSYNTGYRRIRVALNWFLFASACLVS